MTGGFALVAYPAEHGSSGIMTFVVGPAGHRLPEEPRREDGGRGEGDHGLRSRRLVDAGPRLGSGPAA